MRKKSTKDFPDWPDVPTGEQLMEALQEYPKRNIRHLVAEMQGKVVGELLLNEDHPPDASANFFLVHPDYRGRGIGTQMLREAISQLSKKGFCVLGLGTWKENRRALHVYRKTGFRILMPEHVLLFNFFGIPLVKKFFQEHPQLGEVKLDEKVVIEGISCSSVSWKDTQTYDSLTLYFKRVGRGRLALIALELKVKGRELKCRLTAENWSPCMRESTRIRALVEGSTIPVDKIYFKYVGKDPGVTIDAEETPTQVQPTVYSNIANVTAEKTGIYNIIMKTHADGTAVSLWNSINVLKLMELYVRPRILFLSPGQAKDFLIQLKNNSNSVAQVEAGLEAKGEIGLEDLPKRRIDSMRKGDLIKYGLQLRAKVDCPAKDWSLKVFASSKSEVLDEKTVFLRTTTPGQVRAMVIWGGGWDVGGWDKPLDSFMASQNKVAVDLIHPYSWDSPEFKAETLKQNYDVTMIAWLHKGSADFSVGQLKAWREHVSGGGGFVMGGSWRNYQGLNEDNQGNFHGTPVEEILPVVISDTYDARNTPVKIKCLKPDHPVMKGIDWETCPSLRGYNQVAGIKSSAEVLAIDEKSGNPLIVTWEYKEGRAMSFLSDLSGGWGRFFKDWSYYNTFLTNMMLWLAKKT